MSALSRLVRVDRKPNSTVRHVRITLRTLINACALQGINVDELLLNPMEAASLPLVQRWGEYKRLELSLSRPADLSLALEHCLRTLLDDAHLWYLPSPNFALKEMKIGWKDLTSGCRMTIKRYKQRYCAQGNSSSLIKRDKLFESSLACIKAIKANPFATPSLRQARRKLSKVKGIDLEEATCMAKCARHWRRIVELSKAHTLGVHGHQLKAYKKLGGVVDGY